MKLLISESEANVKAVSMRMVAYTPPLLMIIGESSFIPEEEVDFVQTEGRADVGGSHI